MAVVLPNLKKIVVPMPHDPEHVKLLNQLFIFPTLHLPDGDVIALPHHNDVLKMLSNMGIDTEGCDPFSTYYDPPTSKHGHTPWWWQMETAAFLASNPYAFVTSTPRTGKTLSTLLAIDYLQRYMGVQAALIVAPLTVAAGGEWEKTCEEWFPQKRVQLIHNDRMGEVDKSADIYLINPDGLSRAERGKVSDKLRQKVEAGRIGICVFDELTEYGGSNGKPTQRWQAAHKVASKCPYRWGLTGTPGAPDKIYLQVKLINPTQVPDQYIRWKYMTMQKITQFKWIPKHGHEALVKAAMSPCIRFDKEQLMKIPVPQVLREDVPLSPQQRAMSKELVEQLQYMIDTNTVEATTASTLAQKLLQVSGGAVRAKKEGEASIVRVDATPKLTRLAELLRATPRKKVVFSSFTALNDMLVEFIRSEGFSCEKIDGSVTGLARSKILRDFLDEREPHVLVCHPRTTAFGVELASADYIICYGVPLTGAFMYQQMFERLSSARQTAKETFVVHLSAGAQDKLAFSALERGVNIERNIVNLFTKNISGFGH